MRSSAAKPGELTLHCTAAANREVPVSMTELEYLCLLVDEMSRGAQMPVKTRCARACLHPYTAGGRALMRLSPTPSLLCCVSLIGFLPTT